MVENNMGYLLSRHILTGLKDMKLISEKEFELIDLENKKSFKTFNYKALT